MKGLILIPFTDNTSQSNYLRAYDGQRDVLLARLVIFAIILNALTALFTLKTFRVGLQVMVIVVILFLSVKNYRCILATRSLGVVFWSFWGMAASLLVRGLLSFENYDQLRYLLTVYLPTLVLPVFFVLGKSAISPVLLLRWSIALGVPLTALYLGQTLEGKLENWLALSYLGFLPIAALIAGLHRFRLGVCLAGVLLLTLAIDTSNRFHLLTVISALVVLSAALVIRKIVGIDGDFALIRGPLLLAVCSLIVAPYLCVGLGYFWGINVFTVIEDLASGGLATVGVLNEFSLIDSRTMIYRDAYTNLSDHNGWWLGSGVTRQYFTELAYTSSADDFIFGRVGGSESGVVGLAMFGGAVFLSLATLLVCGLCVRAVFIARNTLAVSLSIFLALRWGLAFVENPWSLSNFWVTFFLGLGWISDEDNLKLTDRDISSLWALQLAR